MNRIFKAALGAVACAALLVAQKQPQPKSKKELEAIQALFNAQDPQARITAGKELISKFADTEFKAAALFTIADSYQRLGDTDNMIVYAERTIEADPKNYGAMIMIASSLAQKTREFDLDKEEKLTRAEKLANSALENLKEVPKPNPNVPDDQWNAFLKDSRAEAHQALGMAATARKKYDVAITEYKAASEMASQPDSVTLVRLGSVYNLAGKPDDAIAVLDKVLAMPDLNPQVKQVAQSEKARAAQAKGPAKPAAPAAPAAAPPKP